MEVFTIYHIPGVKVGCTKNWSNRMSRNRVDHGKDIKVEVLQRTTCIDMADEMENVYSIELGYGDIKPQRRYKYRYEVGQRRIGKQHTLETKKKLNEVKDSTVYKELTTNTQGKWNHLYQKFDCIDLHTYAKRGTPLKKGKHKGLHFVIIEN